MSELLLGRQTPLIEDYSPQLLYPIARGEARSALGITGAIPFYGVDVWHAYEISWLDSLGKPQSRVGRFTVPCTSPNLVESKSFKLYLNSLNSFTFDSDSSAKTCIEDDISAIAGEAVSLTLLLPDDPILAGHSLDGVCLDTLEVSIAAREPAADMIKVSGTRQKEERLYSHLLRSLCPVTGQPDWASVWIHYCGGAIDHKSLLRYIIAYRHHQEFHEHCVERMFRDVEARCDASFLHIQAFYTRRGGLDISPYRSTESDTRAQPRLNRQ